MNEPQPTVVLDLPSQTPTPRKVLHVLHSLERSGMEMMLLNSSEEWQRRGYKCDVLATAREIGPLADRMRACGLGVFHIPFRSAQRYLPRARFITEFYRLCGCDYDVVHIHTEAAPPVFALLAKLAGVRRIALTPHGFFDFDGLLRYRKVYERRFVRMLGGRYGMISEGVKRNEWERFGNSGARISNWIDTLHFRPPSEDERAIARAKLDIESAQFVIVSVGNCSDIKNHDAVIRALTLLPQERRPIYLHLGRERSGNSERKLAAGLRVENQVRFMGAQADPLPFLWAADVFTMPSLHEGLGIAAVEAIAAGTPCVLSDVQGLRETAALTKWAILTSTAPEAVAKGLTEIAMLEPSERRSRAEADSIPVRQKFTVRDGVTGITSGLYE